MPPIAQLWTRAHAREAVSDATKAFGRALFADDASVPAEYRTTLAYGLLLRVRAAVAENHPDGHIADVEDFQLELWAGWAGERFRFAQAFRRQYQGEDGRVAAWETLFGAQAKRREYDRTYQQTRRGGKGPESIGAFLDPESASSPRGHRADTASHHENGADSRARVNVDTIVGLNLVASHSQNSSLGEREREASASSPRGHHADGRLQAAERERQREALRVEYEARAVDWIARFKGRHPGDFAEYLQHAESEAEKLGEMPASIRERTVQGLIRQRLETRGFASYEAWCAQREEVACAAD